VTAATLQSKVDALLTGRSRACGVWRTRRLIRTHCRNK
jgi:hypothetical protein